jgi:hypothetical protein
MEVRIALVYECQWIRLTIILWEVHRLEPRQPIIVVFVGLLGNAVGTC